MTLVLLTIFIAGMIMLARSALFWLYWIQTKSNRLDRIWSEIKSRNFWRLIFSQHRIAVMGLLLVLIVASIYALQQPYGWHTGYAGIKRAVFSKFMMYLFIAFSAYIMAYALMTGIILLARQVKLPKFTAKSVTLLLLVVAIELFAIFYYSGRNRFKAIGMYLLLPIEIMQPVVVLGIFILAYTPNIFLHRYFIRRARKKIAAHKKLIVIGITGSYGKTSTKEYLAHILGAKYKVLKTPEHINVDTGVAKVILRDLKPEHEVFIVEMGAYRRGEIKKICDLVHPQHAMLTGLSDQHFELFGSMEAIAEAKFELAEAVRDQSHIVSNADSESLVSGCKRRRMMPVWYGVAAHAVRFKPTDIVYCEDGTTFKLHGVLFHTPVFGTAALNNLLGAITMAVVLGLHLETIALAVQDLPLIPGTMEVKHDRDGALILDDTYNANTKGVLTALKDLAHCNRTKRVAVFSEVIELGQRAREDHVQIAQTIAQTTDYVLLRPSRQRQLMCNTLVETGYDSSHILGIKDIEQLKQIVDKDTVVLCEGRDAEKIMKVFL